MRKRLFIILLTVLMVISSAAFFAACDDGSKQESNIHVISEFESEDEFFQFNYFNEFGIIKLNTDPTYVKGGSGSAYMEIHGNPVQGSGYKPYMVIYNDTEYNDKTDYTDVEEFRISVYNASDRDVNMYFQFRSASFNKSGYSSEQKFVLTKGQWNEVSIPVDRALINTFIDLDQISEFYIKFDNRESRDQNPAKLYMDSFIAIQTDEPIPTGVKVREDNELESANKAEYLSAWEASNGATLSLNTDPKYILEGEASFCWTGAAMGGTSWPRLDFTGNILTDISGYDSIYFWIYNANPDDYQLVVAGKITCGTAIAGEWTLIEMPVSWLKTVPNWDNSGFEFDVKNFNNFNMVVTNNNQNLTFYIDAFYARMKDDPIIGTPESAQAIQLSNTNSIDIVGSGDTVTVPAVLNADAYAQLSWKVYEVTQVGTMWTDSAVAGTDNAESFVTDENYNRNYRVIYTAVDAEGRKAKATYTVLTLKDDMKPLSALTGCEDDLEAFQDTRMTGDYVKPEISVSSDEQFNLIGENSVKITIPADTAAKNYAFTWNPKLSAYNFDSVLFNMYNNSDTERTLITAWGMVITLKPYTWTTFDWASSQIIQQAQLGSPEVHSAEDLALSFHFDGVQTDEPIDIYINLGIGNLREPEPPAIDISIEKTGETVSSACTIKIGKEVDGAIPFPSVPDGAQVTWNVYRYKIQPMVDVDNAVLEKTQVGTANASEFAITEADIYVVEYTVTLGEQTETVTYSVVYDPESGYAMDAEDCSAHSTFVTPSFAQTEQVMFGQNVLQASGSQTGFTDIAFLWKTGITNDLNSVTFYVYNDSNSNINMVFAWGNVQTLYKGVWNKVTLSGDFNAWANQNGAQVLRDTETGEWTFIISHNVKYVTGDFKLYYACTVNEKEPEALEVMLSQTGETVSSACTIKIGKGVDGAIPYPSANEGAQVTWNVYRYKIQPMVDVDNAVLEKTQVGTANASEFAITEADIYVVEYTVTLGEQTETVTYSVVYDPESGYAMDAEDCSAHSTFVTPSFAQTEQVMFGQNVLQASGSQTGFTDIAFLWKTGITNDLNSVTFYVYNDSNSNINMVFAWGNVQTLYKGVWNKVTLSGDFNAWANQNGAQVLRDTETGEWTFIISHNVKYVTGDFKLYYACTVNEKEPVSEGIKLAQLTAYKHEGDTVSVPLVTDATWEIYKDGVVQSDLANATEFVCATGIYEVKYTLQVGGNTETAIYTVFAEAQGVTFFIPQATDMTKIAIESLEYPSTFVFDENVNALKAEFLFYLEYGDQGTGV